METLPEQLGNLDLAGELADDKFLTALESVQLKETMEILPEQLGKSDIT